jgi:hypothetical protein
VKDSLLRPAVLIAAYAATLFVALSLLDPLPADAEMQTGVGVETYARAAPELLVVGGVVAVSAVSISYLKRRGETA